MELTFGGEPPTSRGAPALEYEAVLRPLRARPGEWASMTLETKAQATHSAWRIRRGDFGPGFETRRRGLTVWVRWAAPPVEPVTMRPRAS